MVDSHWGARLSVWRQLLSDQAAGGTGSDPRLQALERIVVSRSFNKSPRLSSFLQYVCTRAVEGRVEEISEQQIGVAVFGKEADYNPGNDNVVRGAARQLRQKLALYYQEEGSRDALRITLPRGGYVPHFQTAGSANAEIDAAPVEDSIEVPVRRGFLAEQYRGMLLGVALCCLVFWAISGARRLVAAGSQPLSDRFWSILIANGGKTFLVPTDSGVVMVQQVTKQTVPVTKYSTSGYDFDVEMPESDSFRVNRFGVRKYTSIADVKLTARIVRLPQVNDGNLEIRFGRDLRVEDLQHSNAILIGGPQGNPWIQLFDKQGNFRIESDDYRFVQTVINANPLPGEKAEYQVFHRTSQTPIYSIVSFVPNLDGAGHVLAISGTSMAGIDAASEFLFRSAQFESLLKEAARPDGTFRNFELLLSADSVSLNAVSTHLVGKRFHD